MHKYFHSLIDLVLYSGFRSTSEDVVEVVVMPPAVHFLWPFGPFSRNRRKSPLNYRGHFGIIPLCKVLQNIPSVVVAVFIWEYSRVIRNITSIPSYNLKATFAGGVTGSVYHTVTGIFFLCLANNKYDLCSEETWMLNKPGKSFMQPLTLCLPWLISYRCHTHIYLRMWRYISRYRKLVDLCVWILFVWYQKLKVSCIPVFRDEGTLKQLQRYCVGRVGPIPLPGRSCEFTLLDIFWSNITEHIYIQPFGILLTEKHTEIEHILRPALFLDCMQH